MNVNLRPDMLRQPGMAQPPMMSLGSGPFMQSPPQSGPQQQSMGIPPNNPPPMGMLPGPPNPNHPMNPQRYPMQMQQQQQHPQGGQPRQMIMRQGQPQMNPAAGGSHMSLGFPPNHMMHQPGNTLAARRGVSQGHLNQGAPHIGPPMQMGLPQQPNMPGQMRQPPPQTIPGPPMRSVSSGHMSPEMTMGIGRQVGNPGMPQNISRTGSAPMPMLNGMTTPSLAQPPSMQGGMPSAHQNNFQSTGAMGMPHQNTQMSSSPRPPSHPSSQPPNMNMGPGPSNPGMSRVSMPPDTPMDFMDFSPQSFPPQGTSNGNSSFPFVPSSSTPPTQMGSSMSRSMPPNMGNTPPNRGQFQPTPAQQFAEMQGSGMQQGSDSYPNFSMAPPRPPSHNHHSTPLQQPPPPPHPHSPHIADSLNHYPPQPHSRPQSTTGRPPSSHDARAQQLPPNPALGPGPPTGRLPPPHPGPQQQPGPPPHLPPSVNPTQPNPPRPPNQPPNAFGGHVGSPASSSTMSSSDQQASTSGPRIGLPPQPAQQLVGQGQGLMRLLQFSGNLSSETKTKLQLSWWNELIKEYFTPKAIMKITLWKDNQKTEAKPFEIGVPILPRFFLVTTQSGVKSMTLTLDGARERIYSQGHSVVECVTAVWTYRYKNGYTVTLRGPLTAHVVITSPHPAGTTASHQGYVLKFEDFQFDANYHDKYISLDAITGPKLVMTESPKTPRSRNTPAPGAVNGATTQEEEDRKWEEPRISIERGSIPGEPVNAFGIPQATMRCLELAESVAQMTDLIGFASDTHLGPLEALSQFANRLRETHPLPPNVGPHMLNGANHMTSNGMMPYPYTPFATNNMSTTLYSSAPPSVTNPGSISHPPPPHLQTHTPSTIINSPQNAPPSANNSPQKAHKSIPQHPQQNAPSTASSSTPTSTVNTPALSNTSLKRKQPVDSTSPITDAAPTSNKRNTRKRRTTGTGGG